MYCINCAPKGGRTFCRKTLCRKTFCRADILTNGLFAEKTFCRTDNLLKIEIFSELYSRLAYTIKVSAIKVLLTLIKVIADIVIVH
jgi:hypothetical protein